MSGDCSNNKLKGWKWLETWLGLLSLLLIEDTLLIQKCT